MMRSICLVLIFFLSLAFSFGALILPVNATTQTFSVTADAYVDSEHPSLNYGGSSYLYAQFWDYTHFPDVRKNIYLLFDLSTLSPSLYDISSASLRLYAWSAWSTTHVGVHQCSDTSWNEIEINWDNAPSFSPSASDTIAVPFEDQWYSWNVTTLVKNALGQNLTLVLRVEDTGDSFLTSFRSKDGYKNFPELVINYTIIPEFSSFVVLPIFMIATLLAVIIYRRKTRD